MKIAFYTTYFTSHTGGVEKLICELACFLSRKGVEVIVFTEDDGDFPLFEFPGTGKIIKCSLRDRRREALLDFRAKVEGVLPDVFVFASSSHTLFTKCINALTGLPTPLIISEHACPQIIEEYHGANNRLLNCSVADGIHLLVDRYLDSLPKYLLHKCYSIPNYVLQSELTASQSRKPNGRYKAINIARLDLTQKRQDLLIKAFAKIADKHKDWDIHIYGSFWKDDETDFIKTLIKDNNLTDRVILEGGVSNIQEIIADANLFVFPSAFEGLSLSVLEAMAGGLPVVAYADCEGVNCVVETGKTGILVDQIDNIDGFSQAMDTLMSDENLRAEYGKQAIEVSRLYSREAFLNGWEQMLIETATKYGNNILLNPPSTEVFLQGLFFNRSDIREISKQTNEFSNLL